MVGLARRRRVHLQREDVDAAGMRRDEVAAACRLRDFGVVPKALRGEQHAEGPRIGELVLPLEALVRAVGQLRVEGLQAVEEGGEPSRPELDAESTIPSPSRSRSRRRIRRSPRPGPRRAVPRRS